MNNDPKRAIEIARVFFGKVLKVDTKHLHFSLKNAGVMFHRTVVSVDLGARNFEVEIDCSGNTIRLVEITTHRKLRYDQRNPLNGFILKDVCNRRVLGTRRLEAYLTAEK